MNPDGSHQNAFQLPKSSIPEVLGLIEILKMKGGREDIYKLAAELKMEFGDTLNVIRAAEMLNLVHTPGGDVVLESAGDQITRSKISERKIIIHDQLEKIEIFKQVTLFLKDSDGQELSKDELLEKLSEIAPNEDMLQVFDTIVHWGRYAELYGYNDDSEKIYLDN
jgi:NitT/TauT family transport system ATP-binding protein